MMKIKKTLIFFKRSNLKWLIIETRWPGHDCRRQTWKNNEAKFSIIQKLKKIKKLWELNLAYKIIERK
jgi:hypothetical protein